MFPVQLTTSRIGNITRLIHSLLYVMTIHMGPQKYKNEQISVGRMGSMLREQIKTGMVQKNVDLCFISTTYGNEVISVGRHKKNTNLRNCSRLSKHCTKPTFEKEMCPRRIK